VSLEGKLEPEARDCRDPISAATISAAVSLKRIADVLAPTLGQDVGTTLFYIEQMLAQR